MNLIKPKKLQQGSTISIVAPAGNVDKSKLQVGINYLEKQGYKVKLGKNLFNQNKYLAGKDEERAFDINQAFADTETDAIICARGGYGAIRLLDKLDFTTIRNNPKIFCGYSDITALSAIILKKSGLITFSAPMIQSDFSDNEIDKFTEANFWETLTSSKITIKPNNPNFYFCGAAQGITFGGNLATLVSLAGIDFIPDEKFILFVEDINEDVYKIDKYFRQLLNIPKFKKNISGIVLGDFIEIDNEIWLDNLFKELAIELQIPVISDYPISHSRHKATVPYGANAILNENGILEIIY